jgi:D-sedoheptulose 7-phosphate isomerase
MDRHINDYLKRLSATLEQIPTKQIAAMGETLYRAYRDDKQVFIIGNGGSASTASHMAADLSKNTIRENMHRFRILSLNDNIPLITALANDIGYESIFIEQLKNLIQVGDVLVVISGSGNSANVVNAAEYAQRQRAEVVAMLGFDGGQVGRLADLSIAIDSADYGVVEDAHLIINHILVEYFRKRFADERPWRA